MITTPWLRASTAFWTLRRASSARPLAARALARDDEERDFALELAVFFLAAGALERRWAAVLRCWAVFRAAEARFLVVALADLRALVARLREDFFGCGISLSLSFRER